MSDKNIYKGVNTICTHVGQVKDEQFGGSVSPIYPGTSYEYIDKEIDRYPRYSSTPNQEFLAKKISALEETEDAIILCSGMASIITSLLGFLNTWDHIVLQNDIYGGTRNLVEAQFKRYGIQYSFTDGLDVQFFEKEIKPNTKAIYIETPSNPLLKLEVAKNKVISLMKDDGFNHNTDFVRVGVKSGGCSGLSYEMKFDNKIEENDKIYEDNDIKIVVDKKSLLYLAGTTLEYSGGLNGKGFVFSNPNANRTCGCGESLSL